MFILLIPRLADQPQKYEGTTIIIEIEMEHAMCQYLLNLFEGWMIDWQYFSQAKTIILLGIIFTLFTSYILGTFLTSIMKTVRFQLRMSNQFGLEELQESDKDDVNGNAEPIKTALVFDKGQISHPTRHKLTLHLKGYFLLSLPLGAFPTAPEYDMGRFDSMIRIWGIENRLLDVNYEANILSWYPTNAVFLIAPALKPWNAKLETLLKAMFWWRTVDHFFYECMGTSVLLKEHFTDLAKFIANIMTGLYRNTDCIPNFDIPFLNHALGAFYSLYVDIKANVAGYEKNYHYFLAELQNWIQSYKIRALYMRSTPEELQQANLMFKKLCGKRSMIELIQLLSATYLDSTIRDNLLFKVFCNSGDFLESMAMDVFLFPRHVHTKDNNTNMILRNMKSRGMSADEALEFHMISVNNEMAYFRKSAEALEAEFPASDSLIKYIYNYKCYIDGFIRMYATQVRYGHCDFKIMKVIPSQDDMDED